MAADMHFVDMHFVDMAVDNSGMAADTDLDLHSDFLD